MCAICGCGDAGGFVLTGAGHAHPHDHVHPQEDRHGHPSEHGHAHSHGQGHAHSHGHEREHGHEPGHGHEHTHGHGHGHEHDPFHARRRSSTVAIERDLMAKNDRSAANNRRWFEQRAILALNLVSAPGAGKTSLLERTLAERGRLTTFTVIEGDQATTNDAERIRATGTRAVQINTGAGCHLDADMVGAGLAALAPPDGSTLMIENVGNLVCPALFDLGEHARVAILSVTWLGRGQATQVPAHLPLVADPAAQQDRPAAPSALRRRTVHRIRSAGAACSGGVSGFGNDGAGHGALVRLARFARRRAEVQSGVFAVR